MFTGCILCGLPTGASTSRPECACGTKTPAELRPLIERAIARYCGPEAEIRAFFARELQGWDAPTNQAR